MSKLCRFAWAVAIGDARCPSNVIITPHRSLLKHKTRYSHIALKRRRMSSSAADPTSTLFSRGVKLPYTISKPLLLTFDAFGTLYSPRLPVSQQYAEEAQRFGLHIEASAIESVFRSSFKVMSQVHPNYGKGTGISYQDWWSNLIRIVFILVNQKAPDSLVDALFHRFSTNIGYEIKEDVLELLRDVVEPSDAWSPSCTMLGVISNSDPRVESILSSHSIDVRPEVYSSSSFKRPSRNRLADFSFITLSYNCGVEKPNPKIYEAALQDAQEALEKHREGGVIPVPADIRKDFHHMHVGDDLQNDVLPALKSGWNAVLLDRRLNPSDVETRLIDGFEVPTIGNLAMLTKLVSQVIVKAGDNHRSTDE